VIAEAPPDIDLGCDVEGLEAEAVDTAADLFSVMSTKKRST
jgi:hypothetical protein